MKYSILSFLFLIMTISVHAQYYEPSPELAVGLKAVYGRFTYGKSQSENTGFYRQGNVQTYSSRSPFYIPINAGFYIGQKFVYGMEVFYAKGINNVEDLWGAKIMSIAFNANRFKLGAAYEIYAQVRNRFNGGPYGSFQFYWNLKKNEERY